MRIEPVLGEIAGAFTTNATLSALVDVVGRGDGCVGTTEFVVPPAPPPPHALTLTVSAASTASF
jgi:hypothetical protein